MGANNSQTLSKKQAANGGNTNTATKSIMRPSRKTTDEHHKSRAKMLAVANSASKNDDPYYCGLRARVPNFVNGQQQPGQGRIQGKEGGKEKEKDKENENGKENDKENEKEKETEKE